MVADDRKMCVPFCCGIQFLSIVSTIISSSYIGSFHSRTLVFEKTFSLALSGKLRNIPRVAYSYRNGVVMSWAACSFLCVPFECNGFTFNS